MFNPYNDFNTSSLKQIRHHAALLESLAVNAGNTEQADDFKALARAIRTILSKQD